MTLRRELLESYEPIFYTAYDIRFVFQFKYELVHVSQMVVQVIGLNVKGCHLSIVGEVSFECRKKLRQIR